MNVRLDHKQQQRLEEAARYEGVTVDDLARQLIDEGLAGRPQNGTSSSGLNETFFDAATRIGLIACAGSGLPPDLSTNPQHLDGLGR